MKLLFSDTENNTCRTVVPGRKKTNKMNPTITLGFYLEAHSGPRRRVKGSKQHVSKGQGGRVKGTGMLRWLEAGGQRPGDKRALE